MDANKQAGLVIPESGDLPTVGRYALGGAAAGGGAAALLSLIRHLRLERQLAKEEQRLQNPTETDENTIVLTLPPKQAESGADKKKGLTRLQRLYMRRGEDPVTGKPNQLDKAAGEKQHPTRHRLFTIRELQAWGRSPEEGRRVSQEVDEEAFGKQANDPATFAMSMLAAMGGGTAAYQLVRQLYHKRLMAEIKAKEEAARTAVLDQMMSQKEAQSPSNTFSWIDAPLGMAVLMALLGAGTSGYVTKRVLDEKFNEADRDKYEPPKGTRVVFRTAPATAGQLPQDEKIASDDEVDALRTGVILHMVKASGDMSIFEDAEVKAAMTAAGTDAGGLMGLTDGQSAVSGLLSGLLSNKNLRYALQRAYLQDTHPILNKVFGWSLKVPGLSNIADALTYRKLGVRPMAPKLAMFGLPTPSGIANSLIGSLMAESATKPDVTPVAAPEAAGPDKKKMTPEELAAQVELTAKDPQAQAFLEAKRARIRKLLIELAAKNAPAPAPAT